MNAALGGLAVLGFLCAAPPPSADELAIRQVVDSFRQRLEQAQPTELLALFWPGAVIFEEGGLARSPEVFVRESVLPRLDQQALKWVKEENSGRAEGNLAYVAHRALLEATPKQKGQPSRSQHTMTFVLRKKEGAWKIAHLHWSTRPEGR